MTDQEATQFNREQLEALVPEKRRPYMAVANALFGGGWTGARSPGQARMLHDRFVAATLTTVLNAHEKGVLEPPLTPELLEATRFGVENRPEVTEANPGIFVLQALFSHGFTPSPATGAIDV